MKNSKDRYEDFNPLQINKKYTKYPKPKSESSNISLFFIETKTSLLVLSINRPHHLHLLYFDHFKLDSYQIWSEAGPA